MRLLAFLLLTANTMWRAKGVVLRRSSMQGGGGKSSRELGDVFSLGVALTCNLHAFILRSICFSVQSVFFERMYGIWHLVLFQVLREELMRHVTACSSVVLYSGSVCDP